MAAADKAKLNAATACATASTLVARDAAGRAQVADPSAGADIATKSYVDAAVAIKLDNMLAPDDNTDLNATTARHGLLRKLDGDIGHVLRADGAFGTVPGGGGGGQRGRATLVHAVHGPRRAAGGVAGAGPAVELGAQARRGAAADAGRAGRRLVPPARGAGVAAGGVAAARARRDRRRAAQRDDDPKDRQRGEAHRRIGELNMENELVRARLEKPGPLVRRRSR